MDYRKQATVGLLGGIVHVSAILIFTFLYVSIAGFEYSITAFIDGGVPILVLSVLGAAGVLLYYNAGVITPIALILAFDIIAVVSSPPEIWTLPGAGTPPPIYELYIFFFVVPLGIAILTGTIEYFTRKGMTSETVLPDL